MIDSDIEPTDMPRIAQGHRMQFEPAQDCHVLLYPEGMVTLNPSAAEILSRCDGKRSVATICSDLSAEFGGADLEDDVHQFLSLAIAQKWVVLA
ncbi:pyrroloquinoline quinone biosynthesis peptide chaperone PqqD [Salinisphaera aquimarina]|uniref:PqqA binding protein n=1 Tax=Salinisphaera aquimarina TaxID=2094031 RepID=A0ABV7EPJ2_9GAMM